MEIFYDAHFKKEYKKQTSEIKDAAEEKEKWFRNDPFDSRLKTHKLKGELKGYWAFWIKYKYRIMFTFNDDDSVNFYSIGDHDIYD